MIWLSRSPARCFYLLYAHRFFFGWASAAAAAFEYAYLLHRGVGLPIVFLFSGTVFLISGVTASTTVFLTRRYGIPKVFALSMICSAAASFMVAQIDWSLTLALSSVAFSGIAMGLYYPIADVLEAIYVTDEQRRGRQITLGMAFNTLGAAAGAALGGMLIGSYGYAAAAIMTALVYGLSLLPVWRLPRYVLPAAMPVLPYEIGRYIVSDRIFRPFRLIFFFQQLCIVMKVFIPVYIFLALGNFAITGFVIAGAATAQVLLLAALGRLLDRFGHAASMAGSAWLYALSCLGFLLVPLSVASAALLETTDKVASGLLDGAFSTRLHSLLRAQSIGQLLPFGAAWQITLCAWEVFTLTGFAVIASLVGTRVFPILFMGGIAGALVQYYSFPRKTSP